MNIYQSETALNARGFVGTLNWYRHPFGILFTDGVHWLREELQCHWLIDDIAVFSKSFQAQEQFMTADFSSHNHSGMLKLTDGNDNELTRYSYAFTTLSIDRQSLVRSGYKPFLRFFLIYAGEAHRHVLLLPSEY